ncbi:MDR family MFS transporter [Aneurinibacillus aneurinilyticus]|uniref:MDR family MFS transporter n=1 Tax=Aneurinibacillus aneurinilyticus TaxID=1391 RepID=UPI002E215685|nr:MDR family MFS transporter [Aneurinibacillus aneurinilyticus]
MDTKANIKVGWIIAALAMGMVLSALDATVVATAMPTIVDQLGGFSLYSWVFSIYMMMTIVGMPIFGKLSDQYGRTKTYLLGMGLFMLGSLLCGLSLNMTMLVFSRGIQGIGAGAVVPVTLTIVGDLFTPEKRAKMQGIFGALFGVASVLGPSVGGYLVAHGNWTWAFYINLPFGILGMLFIRIFLPEYRDRRKLSIDWKGCVTLILGTSAILYSLVLVGHTDPNVRIAWNSLPSLGLWAIGAAFLIWFVRIESRAEDPVVPLSLFKNRVILFVCITAFCTGVAMYGAITYIPLFLQKVLGDNAADSGNALIPLMLSFVISSVIGGRLLLILNYRTVLASGMLFISIGFLLFSSMDSGTTRATVTGYMLITGVGMGFVIPILTIAMQEAVGKQWRGSVTSAASFFRMFGGVFGVSMMATWMSTQLQNKLPAMDSVSVWSSRKVWPEPEALLMNQVSRELPPELFDSWILALTASTQQVFYLGFVLTLFGFAATLGIGGMKIKRDQEQLKA